MSQFDLFQLHDSWLHRLDPRAKLWAVLLASAAGLVFRQVTLLAGLLLLAHMALLSAHISPSRLRWLWSRLAPLLLMIVILQPLFAPGPGPNLLRLGPLRWTVEGLLGGASFALRAASLAFIAALLLFTTDLTRLIQGMVKLGIPYPWGLTLGLALRYLPETYSLFLSIGEAQQARGWEVGQGGFVRRARSYLPVLVATIIASLRRSESLGMALAARGMGYTRQRTTLSDLCLRGADRTVILVATLVFAGLMALRFGLGWGGGAW